MDVLFIGGTGRSGTTILRKAMGAANGVHVLRYELMVHVYQGGLLELLSRGRAPAEERYLDLVESIGSRRPKKVRWPQLVAPCYQAIRRQLPPRPTALSKRRRLADAFLSAAYGNPVGGILVEDSPPNMSRASELAEVFRGARFCHMVRHPRDVLGSTARMRWAKPTASLTARSVADLCRRSIDSEQSLGERAIRLRLEDLRDQPSDEMERLGRWLGVDLSASAASFDPKRIGTYELDAAHQDAYLKHLHPLAVELGYEAS